MYTLDEARGKFKALGANQAQLDSLTRVIERQGEPEAVFPFLDGSGCLMVKFPHITIGIEADGHAHS